MRTLEISLSVNVLSLKDLLVGDRVLIVDQKSLARITADVIGAGVITVTDVDEHRFAGTTLGKHEKIWYDAKEVGLTPYSQTLGFSERFVVTFDSAIRVVEFNDESLNEYGELATREPLTPTPAE